MPDKGKRGDGRTKEEIAEHYKQKAIRYAARDKAHYEAKAARIAKQYEAKAARIEKKYKDKEKRQTRAKAKQLHRKAIGTAKDRYTPEYMANYKPWDL